MGKTYNTKIIVLFMLVLLGLATALRITSHQAQEPTEGQQASQVTDASLIVGATLDIKTARQAGIYFADESIRFYMDTNEAVQEKIAKSGGKHFQVIVARDGDQTRDNEINSIEYENTQVRDLVRNEYNSFFIVPDTDADVKVNYRKLFVDFLGLTDKYTSVQSHFTIEEKLSVADVELGYFFNADKNGYETRQHHIALLTKAGEYRVEALPVFVKTILVYVPRDQTKGTYVSFQGYTDFDDGSEFDTPETAGYDKITLVHTDTWSTYFSDYFDTENPEFLWELTPSKDQISVDLLVGFLDQANSVDKRISAQLGETDEEPFDKTETLVAPKGLDSFNKLPILSANLTSASGELQAALIRPDVPNFSFLPLELETSENDCLITYYASRHMQVIIHGITKINGQSFVSEFIKPTESSWYTIVLYGEEGSKLTFADIKKTLFTTMELGHASTILTTDKIALAKLNGYGITEDETVVERPTIKVTYDTYLMYSISGKFTYEAETPEKIDLKAEFVNLDGSVLSYVRFYFGAVKASGHFYDFFDLDGADAGFRSLHLSDFQIISANRDFNTDKVTQIRHSNIMVVRDNDVIVKDGLTVLVDGDLKKDCTNYVFCRLAKDLKIPSTVSFSGLVRAQDSIFTSDYANFTLNDHVTFNDNTLDIRVGEKQNKPYAYLHLRGNLTTIAEPDRKIDFETIWSFGDNAESPIYITGSKNNIYDNVFNSGILDLVESEINGRINPDTSISHFNFTSTAVLGRDCYSHRDYVDQVQESAYSKDYEVRHFDSKEIDEENGLQVITNKCKVGKAKFYLMTEDSKKNYYTANFMFDDFEDFLKITYDVNSDDKVFPLIRMIDFPDGLTTITTYERVEKGEPMEFFGRMDLLGVHTYGHVYAYPNDEKVDAVLDLPTFSIGGGNLQFITTESLKDLYKINEDTFCNGRLDCYINRDEFLQNNTMKFTFDTRNIAASDIILNSNIVIFEILDRVEVKLEDSKWNFRVNGKPFRGSFDTEVLAEVVPVPNIQKEDDSIVRIVLDQTHNFYELEKLVNDELKRWVSGIISAKLQINDRENELLQARQYLVKQLQAGDDCGEEEQCRDLPRITCKEYAQEAVCVKEEKVCETVVQKCVEHKTYTTNYGSYDVCVKYDTVCENDEMSIICVDYDLKDIPTECISMELTCNRILTKDLSCAKYTGQLKSDIGELDDKLERIDELQALLRDLTDSSVCLIRVTDQTARESYTYCNEKDKIINKDSEEFNILDFFSLRDSRAIMKLRNVVSSDSLIFESDVSLYGDWTTKEREKDRIVVKNNVYKKKEDRESGYDLGVESLMFINHYLDFNSVNHTSYELSESVKQVVCKENNIQSKEAARIQVLMRELSLVDGNSTFCPDLEIVDNSIYSKVDDNTLKQPNVYNTYKDDDEYVSNTLAGEGASELKYKYRPESDTVPVSDIRQTYDLETYVTDVIPKPLGERIDEQLFEEAVSSERTLEERRQKEEQDLKILEEELKKEEEEAEKQLEDQKHTDEEKKQRREELKQKRQELEERKRKEKEEAEERKRKAQEEAEERKRKAAEEAEARRKREIEEAEQRKKQEEEERIKRAEEEKKRLEEEEKRRQQEEEDRRKALEEEARAREEARKAAEEKLAKENEERERKRKELEEAIRAAEEAARNAQADALKAEEEAERAKKEALEAKAKALQEQQEALLAKMEVEKKRTHFEQAATPTGETSSEVEVTTSTAAGANVSGEGAVQSLNPTPETARRFQSFIQTTLRSRSN